MDHPLPKPPPTLSRSISVVSSTYEGSDDGELLKPAGRSAVRYGNGRSHGVELVPQMSDSPLDPLNWPAWKKDVAFASLCFASATVGFYKFLFVTVNELIATQFNVSSVAAAALTGVPLMFSAFFGLGFTVLAQVFGKRPIYLATSTMMLIGALWNMHAPSYAQFMVSRILQSLAWGAFDTLVVVSVRDIFLPHERSLRINIYNAVSLLSIWGWPILGGYVSQSEEGFSTQIMIINIIQAFSIAALILVTPETSFNRSTTSSRSTNDTSTFITTTVTTNPAPSGSPLKRYLFTLRPLAYKSSFRRKQAIASLRALSAPSTILTFLLTVPLNASAFGIAFSLSLIFSAMPIFLFPSRIGFLFTLPAVFSLLGYASFAFFAHLKNRPPNHLSSTRHLAASIPGILLGVSGLLSFGLYAVGNLSPKQIVDSDTNFALDVTGQDLSLRVVSLLFGLLVVGAVVLESSGSTYLSSSTLIAPTSLTNELETAHKTLQNLFIGIFIIGFPAWIGVQEGMLQGLRNTVIVLAVLQVVIGSTVGALFWAKSDMVRSFDARVLGAPTSRRGMAHKRWGSNESFFEP